MVEQIKIIISGDDLPDPDDLAFNIYEMLERDGYDVAVTADE